MRGFVILFTTFYLLQISYGQNILGRTTNIIGNQISPNNGLRGANFGLPGITSGMAGLNLGSASPNSGITGRNSGNAGLNSRVTGLSGLSPVPGLNRDSVSPFTVYSVSPIQPSGVTAVSGNAIEASCGCGDKQVNLSNGGRSSSFNSRFGRGGLNLFEI